MRRLVVGVGGGPGGTALPGTDLVLNLGATHPSTHGALRLALELDGDLVTAAEPVVGYVHRGAEKLFEVRDYRQVMVLANRHDWLAAFCNEVGVALAVELLMGMEVPPRATWLRTLLCELNRVLSHVAFLSAAPLPGVDTAPDREAVQTVMEQATGGRLHFSYNRVGGLLTDVPQGWPQRVGQTVAALRPRAQALRDRLDGALAPGLGVLARELVPAYGVSGPVARASGWDLDLRRDEPYLAYGELDVPVVLRREGDARARWLCLAEQVLVSLDLVQACLDRLPPGPVGVRLPKTVKAPEGAVWTVTENPLGTMGYHLVSHGERTPWRLAMRTASFGNASVLPALLPGTRLQDLAVVLGSLFYVLGDLDK